MAAASTGMGSRLAFTLCCAAAASFAVCAFAIGIHRYKRRRAKLEINDGCREEKPQKKFKRILADNSYSPFLHLHQHGEGDTAKISHPYEDRIRYLLDHPPHPLQFNSMSDLLSMDGPYTWIQERSELEVLSQLLSCEHVFAVDTEQHSLRSFLGFTALIQISTQKADYLVDAIALHDDIHLLQSVFANPQICKVFHGADSDILWLQRDFHIYVVNLFDTTRACDVLGKPQRSLAYLLQTYCGIHSNKIFQRADWRLRPLPDLMVEYARIDAHYLLYIADCLCSELIGSKIGEDQLQTTCSDPVCSSLFEEVTRRSNLMTLQLYEKDGVTSGGVAAASSILSRYYSSQGASSYKSRKPSNALGLYICQLNDGKFEQIVRKLCLWRDSVARAEDESSRFVLSDQAIVFLARAVPTCPKKIYSTIATADSISQTLDISSFMAPIPSPSPVVYAHINDICYLLREESVNTNYCLQEGNSAGVPSGFNTRNVQLNKRNRHGASRQGSKEASRAQFARKFSCKSPVYHNCRIYASDGRLLCYCDRKKLDWYIRRDLAELVEDNPPAIKLLFEPKGRPEDENNQFYIESKKNLCVGCGETNHYLRYRIIPSCYRMHFPEHLKSHRSHDIVLLCVDCHEIAHSAAEKYKKQISVDFEIPLFAKKVVDSGKNKRGINEPEFVGDGGGRGVSPLQLRTAAMALLHHGSAMPKERHEELVLVIKTYFGGRDITDKDLEVALLVGMGPREKRRLRKERGLVINDTKNSSDLLEDNNCRGRHVEALMSERISATEEIGAVSPAVMESEDICFVEDNEESETLQDYVCETNKDKQVEASLFSGLNEHAEESIHCTEKESDSVSNENGCLEGDFSEQQKDFNGFIYAEDTRSDVVLEHSYNSCSSSPKMMHAAGCDYIDKVFVEPMTNNSTTSKRSQKISLLGHGPHGKRVVDKLLEKDGEEGIRQFCQRWRTVFVEAVKPRFLPSGWDIQHSGRREFGDYSVYNPSKKNELG
ncbi:protein RRP6-like 3 isoform X2 [Cryptomeria japonica]|uniref:protein RRP6-like 3 isoform X2 n=1 Tax=Cryptomeria japonica TaxID=3369 RepID=UPI0027DA8EBB|nr:protein RRP6-like 3 isoform X2 [Cryptomeria japonica]